MKYAGKTAAATKTEGNPAKPTDVEIGKLKWNLESCKVAKTAKEAEDAFNNVCHILSKYPDISKLYDNVCAKVKSYRQSNPIFDGVVTAMENNAPGGSENDRVGS